MVDSPRHAAWQGIGTKVCPKYEVLCEELGGDLRWIYETHEYMSYSKNVVRRDRAKAAGIIDYFQQLGVNIGNKVYIEHNKVSP